MLSSDVFFDLNMPVWRMQLEGAAAFAAQLRQINEGDVHIDVLRTVSTSTGFVAEHEEHQSVNGRELTARRLWLCAVSGDSIVEARRLLLRGVGRRAAGTPCGRSADAPSMSEGANSRV